VSPPGSLPLGDPVSLNTAPSTTPKRRWLHWVGLGLMLASVLFVARRIGVHVDALKERLDAAGIALLIVGASVYAASLLLISYTWWRMLLVLGVGLPRRTSHILYSRTQLAKYLPGNIFHFVARHLAFRRLGVETSTLTLAALCEAMGLACAALLLALPGAPSLLSQVLHNYSAPSAAWLGIAAVAVATASLGLWLLLRQRSLQRRISPLGALRQRAVMLLKLLPLYVLFMAIGGSTALVLHEHAAGTPGFALVIAPAYTLAWLCGFVIPGASGGLGVREAALLLVLGSNPAALFVALGMRLVTTLGDVLFFSFGLFLPPSSTRDEQPEP